MFCPECGKKVEAGVPFCSGCGAKAGVDAVQTPKTEKTMRGFFASLFEFSFSELITLKLIKILYVLSVIVAALFTLALVVAAFFVPHAGAAIATMIFSPLIFLLIVILCRVWFEMLLYFIMIAEGVKNIAQKNNDTISS